MTREVDLDATHDAINEQNNGRGVAMTLDGVHGHFTVETDFRGMTSLRHTPSAKGRRSEAYREHRRILRDDYTSHFECEWPEAFFARIDKLGLIRYK